MAKKIIGRYIVADPRICHGKLTFKGTRIFVEDVLEMVARGLHGIILLNNGMASFQKMQLKKQLF